MKTIELDNYIQDLLKISSQTVIKTPKEWNELISFLKVFVINTELQ